MEPAASPWHVEIDRCAHERADETLLDRLFDDPGTRVLELRAGLAQVGGDDTPSPRLRRRPPDPADSAAFRAFLGRDGQARPYALAAYPDPPDGVPPGLTGADAAGRRWWPLREIGARLGDLDAGLFLTGLALTNWHRTHPCCSRCGTATVPALAGWVRRCPNDHREHHPRTDPAVIMAVVGPDERLLLGRDPLWPPGRRSVLAGFVEPAETLEAAVAREVVEEAGVAVRDVTYVGSQPWPFPASLMVGFEARADTDELTLADGELVEAEWYTREDLAAAVAAGTVALPGRLSIARRLLERWYGSRLRPPVELPFVRPEPPPA